MVLFIKIVLVVLLIAASINFIRFVSRQEWEHVIELEQDFVVRYPRVFLFVCIVFFLLVLGLVLNMLIWGQVKPLPLVLTILLAVLGIPFLLLALVWRIQVYTDYIIHRSMFGSTQQIYYSDIKRVVVTSRTCILYTTLKTYRFSTSVHYLEYFLKKLQMEGVEVERYRS